MQFQLLPTLIAFLPVAVYAIGGLWDAYNKKEQISWILFIKTIVTGLVTAGLITMGTSDMVEQLSATTIITVVLDKLWNAVLKKDPAPPPADAPATPVPPQ